MSWLLSPYAEASTYKAAVYMLASLGLGVFDFVFIVTGLSLGIGLLITLLGILSGYWLIVLSVKVRVWRSSSPDPSHATYFDRSLNR